TPPTRGQPIDAPRPPPCPRPGPRAPALRRPGPRLRPGRRPALVARLPRVRREDTRPALVLPGGLAGGPVPRLRAGLGAVPRRPRPLRQLPGARLRDDPPARPAGVHGVRDRRRACPLRRPDPVARAAAGTDPGRAAGRAGAR